ncbi:MAG: PD-(D/E)XK nuclease family protein [archaeon]|nr:PD-(D/E)XK nuclease family protein [archaeon]
MRRAKTIDELYEEVKGYDYVITNDAPLATALNARIDDYRLDGFAYTPRHLAGIMETAVLREKTLTDLELIERIEEETGYDFRQIHSEIENIRDIRRHTADVKKYLFSRISNEICDSFMNLPSRLKVMDIYDPSIYRSFLDGKNVAVIGLDLFDDLDKRMLPACFDEIETFTNEEFRIDTIHAIGNDRQIAGSIVDLIDLDTCNDTAIVLDSGAAIADAVRSALYRKKIPFKNSLDVKDLSQIRDFIQFLSLALDFDTLRVGDVRELISVYQTGANKNTMRELKPQDDQYLLSRFTLDDDTEPVTRRFIDTMKSIRERTFGYAMDMMFGSMPQKTSVSILLKNMKIEDRKVTSKLVNRLSYAINNISDLKHNEQVPEYEKKGVLLADCKNSVYIDRSFVIYIGLDDSWEVTAPGKDYVDKQKLDEDNAFRISILLQQGSTRIYAVKPVSKGKDTVPCPTFQTVSALEKNPINITSFRDICDNYVQGSWFRSVEKEKHETGGIDLETPVGKKWKFSKSAYNAYKDCPLKFMFSKLLRSEDNEYTVFGNCLHEFAEFYLCYPEIVKANGLDYYLERLNAQYAGISNECQKELDESRFRVYLNNIVRYIDMVRPGTVPLDMKNSSRKYPNVFMLDAGMEMGSSYAESELESVRPLFAKFDVCFGDRVFDYKTGKAKEPKDIIDGFKEDGNGLSEFQSLIYLAVLSENLRGSPCRFDLFFLGDNDIASTKEGFDVMQNVRSIRLCEETSVWIALGPNGTLADGISTTKKYAPFYDIWDSVSDILLRLAEEDAFDTESAVTQLLNVAGLKDNKTNRGAAEGLLKKAAGELAAPYLIDGSGCVLIPSDSMEKFLEKLTEDHDTATKEMSIPIYNLRKGKIPCNRCDYSKVCMKAHEEEEESE